MASTLHDVAPRRGRVDQDRVERHQRLSAHPARPRGSASSSRSPSSATSPNLTARSLRSGRTGAIALAVPELSLSYFAELADAVIEAAERARAWSCSSSRPDGDRAAGARGAAAARDCR